MHQCNTVNSTLEVLDEVFFVQNCKLSDTAEFLDPDTFLNGVKLLVLNQTFFRTRSFSLPDSKERLGAGLWVISNVWHSAGGQVTTSQSEDSIQVT